MATRAKYWEAKLEAHYKEDRETLIPRLLTHYGGMEQLAVEAGISVATLSRWCDAHGIERRLIYVKAQNGVTA